jgi:hypothetical protein
LAEENSQFFSPRTVYIRSGTKIDVKKKGGSIDFGFLMNAVEVSNYLKENVNVDGSARTVVQV